MREPMKKYNKILSLDFELYNSMKYYSICWIGAVVSDSSMRPLSYIDIRVNPATRHKMVGKELKFPFTYRDLKNLPKFDVASKPLIELIDADTLIVGHAVDNDIKMLFKACSLYGMKYPDFDFIDTNAVYGALKGEYAQVGLKTLAETFEIEFDAHNPKEDATATLKALKCMLERYETDLDSLVEKGALNIGKARGGLVRKCEVDCMTARAKEHIENHNALFDAVRNTPRGNGALSGKRVAFEQKLSSNQNLYSLAEFALQSGAKAVPDEDKADIIVTSQLIEGDKRHCRLRDFASRYGAPQSVLNALDFHPNKVTTADGEVISFMQYLKRKYSVKGARGEYYCFSAKAEKLYAFEDAAAALLKTGKRICAMPDSRCIFVVADESELNTQNSDLKVRTYNKMKGTGKVSLITFSELTEQLKL